MPYKLNGRILRVGKGFTHNEITFPSNWLVKSSQAEKDALGITWEADPVRLDDRYYWNGDVNNPKALDDKAEEDGSTTYGLKHTMTAQVKATAGSLLAQTDWYVTRKAERDVAIPTDVASKRTAIVAESDRLEVAISATTTVEELMTVMNAQNWGE